MQSILHTAKELLLPALRPGGTAADFTMGNGHDTLFLSRALPGGQVWAFDIQPAALKATQALLDNNSAGVFNLGYLPWADKAITTRRETTLEAVDKALPLLRVGGVLVIVIYPGHEEGRLEGEALQQKLSGLDPKRCDVLLHRLIHVPECPYILAVERRK